MITVGPDRVVMNIHEALLQTKTSFFTVHPVPNGTVITSPAPNGETPIKEEADNGANVTPENSPAKAKAADDTTKAAESVEGTDGPETGEIKSAYDLPTARVDAFQVFVKWLYNTKPDTPESPNGCKNLIQAYLLALKYSAFPLQDLIVDCIRRYLSATNLDFDSLFIYLLNRHGDDPECKLMRYLIDQTAYDIATVGIGEFLGGGPQNNFILFIGERCQGNVRVALVDALAKVAFDALHGTRIEDPSTAETNDYYAGH